MDPRRKPQRLVHHDYSSFGREHLLGNVIDGRVELTTAGRLLEASWQERVLRGEADLERARRYILENPARWFEARRSPPPPESQPSRMID